MKWFKAFAEVVRHSVLREEVQRLFASYAFSCAIFFNAEGNKKCYGFVFLAHPILLFSDYSPQKNYFIVIIRY